MPVLIKKKFESKKKALNITNAHVLVDCLSRIIFRLLIFIYLYIKYQYTKDYNGQWNLKR